MALANIAALVPAAPGYVGTYDAAVLLGVSLVDERGARRRARLRRARPLRAVRADHARRARRAGRALRRPRASCGRSCGAPRPAPGRSAGDARAGLRVLTCAARSPAAPRPAPRPARRRGASPAGSSMRSASTNDAPGARSPGSRSSRRAAHALGELAADREAEPEAARARLRAAAVEALEDQLAVVARRRPGPWSETRDRRVLAVVGGHDADGLALGRVAQRVVDEDAHDARDGARVARAPSTGPGGGSTTISTPRSRAWSSNSATTARHSSPSSTGSRAHRDGGVEAAEVEQLGREAAEAAQLGLRARELLLGVVGVEAAVAQVLLEQLERPLQRRERRPQLVRGGRDERAPRRLLAAQRLLHRRERPGEVADLVAAAVVGRLARPGPRRRRARRRRAAGRAGATASSTGRCRGRARRSARCRRRR